MTMPAGTYYIGDLCYILHDAWDEFWENASEGEATLRDGRRYAWHYTANGDGQYASTEGKDLGVDAGLIGCIRVEDIHTDERVNISSGMVVTFNDSFEVSNDGGQITFGHVTVFTEYADYDDDNDYEGAW